MVFGKKKATKKAAPKKAAPKVCTQHQDKDGNVCGRGDCTICGA